MQPFSLPTVEFLIVPRCLEFIFAHCFLTPNYTSSPYPPVSTRVDQAYQAFGQVFGARDNTKLNSEGFTCYYLGCSNPPPPSPHTSEVTLAMLETAKSLPPELTQITPLPLLEGKFQFCHISLGLCIPLGSQSA